MPKVIAAFGEVMMRLQVPGYALLSQSNALNYSFSGTGVNVLAALVRLGHTGYLISRLPLGPLGDAAVAEIRKLGISTELVLRGGEYLGMYFLEQGFGGRPSRVTYTNRLESSFNRAPAKCYDYEQISKQADVIHFCGITLAMNEEVRWHMKTLAQAVKSRGGLVVFDANYRPALWGEDGHHKAKPHYEDMLELADIVLMNEKDALFILDLKSVETKREDQLADLMPRVAKQFHISVIAGTFRGINGDNSHSLQGFIWKNQSLVFSPTLTFPVYDRIGAGDAFASGVIHGELAGYSAEKIVQFAVTAGMLAHTIPGDSPTATETDVIRAMAPVIVDIER
ncbi:sugar kinase [Paenibacillus pabuli]|uniref:sugar kinase n=1 Tax=Paenibacillus pabuli TaxID=1472 RepID=UPI000782F04C|nr:sugar kinase [Paenibacillus pabuli]MEC0128314.1 sugar kinase [Paenibacillus pabuli]